MTIRIIPETILMTILKHIASKNADYGEAWRYRIFQHDEYTGTPLLDENGELVPREEYYNLLWIFATGNI